MYGLFGIYIWDDLVIRVKVVLSYMLVLLGWWEHSLPKFTPDEIVIGKMLVCDDQLMPKASTPTLHAPGYHRRWTVLPS